MEDKKQELDKFIASKRELWEDTNWDDEGWEAAEVKDGITIDKKPYKDAGLKFVRAKATIKASP